MDLAPAVAVVTSLMDWYRQHRRLLPWRVAPTPYRVLLSELMLQQTRVQTVIPYYRRFLARWPDLGSLAAASEQEVLQAWSGLGYYSRARNLLRCAREAHARSGLPRTVEELRELPGIGPYTAGAVASIAFGVRTPVVDGNVERVVSRLDGCMADPRREGRRAIWERVGELHRAAAEDVHPGDLNQGLMELGATVCTPRSPRCDECPLAGPCRALAAGRPEAFPARRARPRPVAVRAVAGLLRADGGWVMGCRPPGLLGGTWEPVGTDLGPRARAPGALRAAFSERAGLQVRVGERQGQVVHTFTHRRLTCEVFAVQGFGTPRAGDFYTDVRAVADPTEVPLSSLARRILALHRAPALPLAAEGR